MCYTGKCIYERTHGPNGDPDGECRFTKDFPPDALCQQHTPLEFSFEESEVITQLREKIRNFTFFSQEVKISSSYAPYISKIDNYDNYYEGLHWKNFSI